MNIRQALMHKLQNSTANELKEIIDQGIASKQEAILPGLGVLFEQYYNSLNSKQRHIMLESLAQLLK